MGVKTKERFEIGSLDYTGDPRFDQARDIINEALVRMTLHFERHRDRRSRPGNCALHYELASMAIKELVVDSIDTMCIELKGDGILRLKCNVDFVIREGVDITMFGLVHEMHHVLYPVLALKADGEVGFVYEWMKDPLFVKQALEYWNNDCTMRALGLREMPDVGDAGEPLGFMDPDKAYAAYRKYKKEAGGDPVSREQFLLTPEVCYGYLKEMPKPPKQRHTGGCNHDRGSGTSGDGQVDGIDPEEAESLLDSIFDALMTRALKGDEAARDALLDVGEQVGGESSKWWSDMGLGALIGKEVPQSKSPFWESFVAHAMESTLTDGAALTFPRKEVALVPLYEMMDAGIPLRAIGKEGEKEVLGFIDTSLSMPQGLVDRCLALAGQIEGCTTKWHTFTTSVVECKDPTTIEYSRGGTSFECIDAFITEREEQPDCILIVTDGEAPPISPTWASEAVWVITEGGSMWAADAGMACIESDIPGLPEAD